MLPLKLYLAGHLKAPGKYNYSKYITAYVNICMSQQTEQWDHSSVVMESRIRGMAKNQSAGISSSLAKRRASLNLKPLGE